MVFVIALYVCNRLSKRNWCGIDGKRVLYLFIVLALGAGVIVNVLLKDNFGRARPRDIAEFGGTKVFTPAFVVSRECDKNCSFSSGEGAAGFFALALALALNRRRATLAAAFAVGCVVSYWRVASGAHFLSDTLVSFFVMLIVADVAYYYVVRRDPSRNPQRENGGPVSNPSPPPNQLTRTIRNQLRFQPPEIALMPKRCVPAGKVTVCERVVQVCQPPVQGTAICP